MQRLLAAVLVLAGLGIAGWVALDDTGDDVGTVTVGAQRDTDVATAPSPDDTPSTPAASPSPTRSPAPAPSIGRSSGRIGDVDLSAPPAPTAIDLPSIGVDATIVPVGIDPDGLMTVPDDVSTVGWYRFGASTASEGGTVILAGHVDDRVQGRGAFFDLRAMDVGDTFEVTDEEGVTTSWEVTGRRTYEKESLPIDELFVRDGASRVVLLTCGGDFDRAARSYESNVVVEAVPLS